MSAPLNTPYIKLDNGSSGDLSADPFADRQRQVQFDDQHFESTTTLPQFDGQYLDDDDQEKIPLAGGQGLYP